MTGSDRPFILVGVSDSIASKAALRWAADEAQRRATRLVVVRAWEPAHIASYAQLPPREEAGQERHAVTCELATTLYAAFGAKLPSYLFTEVIEGTPERVLADESAGADMLVLGSTSVPTIIGRSIGPVIRGCLSRAHCPVVVISPDSESIRRQLAAGARATVAA